MESKIVAFNVGGTKYEVTRSLLASHPDTMLARIASKDWKATEDTTEIFIDRNGVRFQFVLDYLRDGKVSLPLVVTNEALLDDLTYFGVEVIDTDAIDDSLTRVVQASRGVTTMWTEFNRLKGEEDCIVLARTCIDLFLQNRCTGLSFFINLPDSAAEYDAAFRVEREGLIGTCNSFLRRAGLAVSSINKPPVHGGVYVNFKFVDDGDVL
jgi:hypothetical protein